MTPNNNYYNYTNDGDKYYQQKDYCKALYSYNIVLQNNPSNPLLLSKKGNTLYMLKEYQAADQPPDHHARRVLFVGRLRLSYGVWQAAASTMQKNGNL